MNANETQPLLPLATCIQWAKSDKHNHDHAMLESIAHYLDELQELQMQPVPADARQLPDLIRYLEGMNDHAVPAREDVLRYLRELERLRKPVVQAEGERPSVELDECRKWIGLVDGFSPEGMKKCRAIVNYLDELETLRAENARLRDSLNQHKQMQFAVAYKELNEEKKKRDELLCVATALATRNESSISEAFEDAWSAIAIADNIAQIQPVAPQKGETISQYFGRLYVQFKERWNPAAVDAACADHIADAGKLMDGAKAYVIPAEGE